MASATALARAALGAATAGAGSDHLVAPAMGAGDVHEHVAECFADPLRMGAAVGQAGGAALVRRVLRDDVDQFLVAGAREI